MELPKRKKIRLNGYDYSSGGTYFVTICVKERQEMLGRIIVGDDAYIVPQIQLSEYGVVVNKYVNRIVGINKYVIMPNHIHMIISIENGATKTQSIPQLIKSFKTLVTKEIGFSMFQRSYHDHIIRDKAEYQMIYEYIDTNPSKWEVGGDAHIVP